MGQHREQRRDDDIVLQSVSILTTAQQTADTTVKNADDYSGRIMSEARSMYEEARQRAKIIVDDYLDQMPIKRLGKVEDIAAGGRLLVRRDWTRRRQEDVEQPNHRPAQRHFGFEPGQVGRLGLWF